MLTGRKTIYCSVDSFTDESVLVRELNNALTIHFSNVADMDDLYDRRRGITPVQTRKKKRNKTICNKVGVNHFEEFVSFKNGYFLTKPCFYSARRNEANAAVQTLNEYLYRSGKQTADNKIVDDFHTVGKGVLFVAPNDDAEVPVVAYAIDPRSAFVAYSMRPGNKPVFGCNVVTVGKDIKVDMFTRDRVIHLTGTLNPEIISTNGRRDTYVFAIDSVEPNVLRRIPIIEYFYNSIHTAAPEQAIPQFDAIESLESNRLDGVEQFIQSIALAVNCQFDEGTTADKIRELGLVCIKSSGDNKADFRILSQQLDQSQTQTLVDDLYERALQICGMPGSARGNTASTSDTGTAQLARAGWYQAEVYARNTEDLFVASNRYFDEILIDILRRKNLLDIHIADFELQFCHGEVVNVQAKAQALSTLLACGMAPELAFAKSGISNDPTGDVAMSKPYLDAIYASKSAQTEEVKTDEQTASV